MAVSTTPAAAVAPTGDPGRLTFAEARRSPCLSCSTSPCCTHLPVHSFTMGTLMDLDTARFLLNFAGIRLGLAPSGEWSVYLARACRFLDADNGLCTVHDTERQPHICATFNPYTCWYRRVFDRPVDDFVWFDQDSLEWLTEHVVFDESRAIVEVPPWEALVARQAPPPPATPAAPGSPEPLVLGPTRRIGDVHAVDDSADAGNPEPSTYDDLGSPCASCAAHCCTHLVFRKPTPQTRSELDHWRFSLGFPGVTAGIDDQGWSLVVETTCRHLDGAGRCSVYGTDLRPLRCDYYDAWTCGFKSRLGPEPQPDFRRLGLAELDDYLSGLRFDDQGRRTDA